MGKYTSMFIRNMYKGKQLLWLPGLVINMLGDGLLTLRSGSNPTGKKIIDTANYTTLLLAGHDWNNIEGP